MLNSYNLNDAIEFMDASGIYDVILPFLLIFVITYAIFDRINIFSIENKKFNLIISLVISLVTVIAHVTNATPRGYDAVEVINTVVPSIILVVVISIALLILIGSFGGETKGNNLAFYFSATSLGLMAIIFVNSVFPEASLAVPVISILIIVFTVFKKGEAKEPGATVAGGIAVVMFVLILFTFGHEVGFVEEIPWWLENESTLIFLIITAVIFSAIGFVTRE